MKGEEIELNNIKSMESMSSFIDWFRVFASNNRYNDYIMNITEKAIQKSKSLNDQKSLIKLYEIKISQYEHIKENQYEILQLIQSMKEISEEINYMGGLALAYIKEWYISKLMGDKEKSIKSLSNSIYYVNQHLGTEDYEHHVCMYSFAIEKWLNEHDSSSATILEKSSDFFFENGFHRSFVQSLAMLVLIYTRTHDGRRILELCNRIFSDNDFFNKLPSDVQAYSLYFVGLGYMLELNLMLAEKYFEESYNIFKHVYKESIYSSYYLVLHSYLVTVKALQGKLEQTYEMINNVEHLLHQSFFDKNLDSTTKKQIRHTLNLNKFYVHSRSYNFNTEKTQDLILDIFEGSKTQYSDFMLLSEFILNANLKPSRMKQLLRTDNFSVNRVKHIISFVLLNKTEQNTSKKKLEKRIVVLSNRERNNKTTFVENVLADLLIAQQLNSLKRYAEISVLLRKYENQLSRIQVLELRLFMEAFIQIGAYRNGDALGLIFHYTTIRKCNSYGFTRLENRLLDYLEIQKREAMPWLRGEY